MYVILKALVFGCMAQEIILDDYASQRMEELFDLGENGFLFGILIGLPDMRDRIVLDLSYALASDPIFLTDGIKGHALGVLAETIAEDDHISGTIR